MQDLNMTLEMKLDMVRKGVRACTRNFRNSRMISGPPAVGKTYTVIQELEKEIERAKEEGEELKYKIITGGIKDAISFYATLADNNDPNLILVLDDINTAITDKDAREILRAATTNEEKRIIHFLSSNRVIRGAKGVHFDKVNFKSKIILITNIPTKKIDPAILSRTSPIEIETTIPELFEWIGKNLEHCDPQDCKLSWKQEVYNFLKDDIKVNKIKKFDWRLFQDCILWRQSALEKTGYDDRGDPIYEVDPIWKNYVKMLVT